MSIRTRDRVAMEMVDELRTYGLKVIVQERRTGLYDRVHLRRFIRLHELNGSEPFFWVSTRLFEAIVVNFSEAGH